MSPYTLKRFAPIQNSSQSALYLSPSHQENIESLKMQFYYIFSQLKLKFLALKLDGQVSDAHIHFLHNLICCWLAGWQASIKFKVCCFQLPFFKSDAFTSNNTHTKQLKHVKSNAIKWVNCS